MIERSAAFFRLAQLIVFKIALGQQLALRGQAPFQIVDAVAEQFGFLDLDDQLAIEIGDALAQIFDAAARLRKFARRLFGIAALQFKPCLGCREFLFGVADAALERIDLGVHRDQLDLAAVRRHRTVGQFGIELGEFGLLVLQRVLGARAAIRSWR